MNGPFLLRAQEEYDAQRKNFKILHRCFSFYTMEKMKKLSHLLL